VALSVAAVVVANPVIAPRADLQIPAVKLSGTGDALDMLNSDFLSAIGPAQTDTPSSPFEVLKDLVSSLAADATYLTKSAIVSAFFAGTTANPELTAASFPYVPAPHTPPAFGAPGTWPSPVVPVAASGPEATQQRAAAAAALPAEIVPAAAQIVMTLMGDVRNISDGAAMSVAFAAGALLVTESGRALGAVTGLIDDGVQQALATVLAVIKSGDPQGDIIDLLRNAIEPASGQRSVVPAHAVDSATIQSSSTVQPPAVESSPLAGSPSAGSGMLIKPAPSAEAVGAEPVQRRKPGADTPVVPTVPAAGLTDAAPLSGVLKADAGRTDTAAAAPARTPVQSGQLRDAIAEARDQVQGVLKNATDAVRKAADHTAKVAAGPTGD
jgi:hypothetical protein